MHRRFFSDQEDPEPEPESEPISENGPGSPSSGDDSKMSGAPSPKKSWKGAEKRVVSVPIGGSKGDAHPPSDSWAWRKYGQKPIKGSPYPRGYYPCSSSKGCPARKQVERSGVDPSMLLITYASDHNHPLSATKHHHHYSAATPAAAITSAPPKFPPEELAVFANQPDLELGDGSLMASEFGWFADDVASSNVLDSPICCCTDDADVEMMFSAREDEESLFADLGELPECSVVFCRSVGGVPAECCGHGGGEPEV